MFRCEPVSPDEGSTLEAGDEDIVDVLTKKLGDQYLARKGLHVVKPVNWRRGSRMRRLIRIATSEEGGFMATVFHAKESSLVSSSQWQMVFEYAPTHLEKLPPAQQELQLSLLTENQRYQVQSALLLRAVRREAW